ncbi:NfeD family protein [Temperatibacter marinus]|uniref:NfeD family protein n=1 Tax=Temperatibacter marinus TaxID=1456591 RepID=A0AA52EFC6_9PROT|nr:NfeD family protein [Temperatibacter marinus]WND01497.1 NfeD family protein [Temperatibacter marinus]
MEQLVLELSFTHWMWLVALFLFLFLEMLAPGIAFLWLGIAAGAMAGLVFVLSDLSWEMQTFIFTLLAVASVMVGRRVIKEQGDIPSENETLNQRGNSMIGRTVTVVVPIENGKGKVKVGDSLWLATGPDKKKGDSVTVADVNGTELAVE